MRKRQTMEIIETFGHYVENLTDKKPQSARRLLKTGWEAQNLKFRYMQDKRLMPADRHLANLMMDTMLRPIQKPEDSVIVSIFTPCEMMQEVGLHPYNVEGFSCYLSASKAERAFLQQAENQGIAETLCSYHKTFLGAAQKGLLPKPKCIVYTNLTCDANLLTFRTLADFYQVPVFAIDVPWNQTTENVQYVADQLKDLKIFLEKNTGKTISEDRLKERLACSKRTLENYKKYQQMRADRYVPSDLVTPLYAGMTNNILLGTAEEEKYTQMLLEDIKKAPAAKGKHIYWMHTIPFWSDAVRQELCFSEKAQIVGCELAETCEPDFDPENPFEAMAERMVYHSLNGSALRRIEAGIRHAKQAGADGAVWFGHWGCKHTLGAAQLAKKKFEEAGLPLLILADQVSHPNICGFGKTLLEGVMEGKIKELVLVSCCDTIRSVYDILLESGKLDFLYILDVLHCDSACSRERMAVQLKGLAKAYAQYKGTEFDAGKFRAAFHTQEKITKSHIAVLGARMGQELFEMTSKAMPLPVENDTCVHNRSVGNILPPEGASFDELMDWYAGEILGQIPCMRMMDPTGRKKLYNDPSVAGIIYHTVKFCDFYSFEYAEIKNHTDVPLLKIESDYTIQSSGQLLTRLEAFAESIQPETLEQTIDGDTKGERKMGKGYFAGIDSGSTSTDVVILNKDHEIVTSIILPTGAGAAIGADRALAEALKEAGLQREDIDALVTTGYGRTAIKNGDKSITEITCHARGAHFLNPEVRTVIDIGGQDSKVIRLDENGAVANFVMNDKCAAGTGRFLEMMARTMEMNLDQMSECGLEFKEDITISSMCTVFAESEVVSLIAQNKATDDIVHGLNKAVAVKTAALTRRVGGEEKYMMTGGVSKNKGLVKTLEEKLGTKLVISDKAQLCGALGAALFAADMADV